MELVNGFNLLTLVMGAVSLLVLSGLFIWYRYGSRAEALPYVLRAIVVVYEFSEEQLKAGNPVYALEKRALVDLTYDKLLPLNVQIQITRDEWAVMVEAAYRQAAAAWDNSAAGLREAFDEWEANRD